MGSATTEDELLTVLQYLETLARQRAAKVAGVAPMNVSEDAGTSPSVQGAVSAQFREALCEACGISSTADMSAELFARLPRDKRGHADLLQVFGLAAARVEDSSNQAVTGRRPSVEYSSAWVERAGDLPCPAPAVAAAAMGLLLESMAVEAQWEADASAINALRAAALLLQGPHTEARLQVQEAKPKLEFNAPLLAAIAQRCGSRRPALAKGALQAMVELAAEGSIVEVGVWKEVAERVILGCFNALRTTKVAARVAEEALAAITRRIAAEASPAVAVVTLAARTVAAVRSRPAQPPVVAAGLRRLAPLAPALASMPGWAGEGEVLSACQAVKELCEEVLSNRTLGSAYSEARSLLQALPKAESACDQ